MKREEGFYWIKRDHLAADWVREEMEEWELAWWNPEYGLWAVHPESNWSDIENVDEKDVYEVGKKIARPVEEA